MIQLINDDAHEAQSKFRILIIALYTVMGSSSPHIVVFMTKLTPNEHFLKNKYLFTTDERKFKHEKDTF